MQKAATVNKTKNAKLMFNSNKKHERDVIKIVKTKITKVAKRCDNPKRKRW